MGIDERLGGALTDYFQLRKLVESQRYDFLHTADLDRLGAYQKRFRRTSIDRRYREWSDSTGERRRSRGRSMRLSSPFCCLTTTTSSPRQELAIGKRQAKKPSVPEMSAVKPFPQRGFTAKANGVSPCPFANSFHCLGLRPLFAVVLAAGQI